MKIEDLALQRSKYKHLTDNEWRWFLQQVEGRERTADKLPTFAAIDDWWYPVRLSCEQCSSELAARYKASLISSDRLSRANFKFQISNFADLTGGYGVDTYFLSEHFEHTDYVEQNAELCRIAAHNFADKPISVHNTSAEEFLKTADQYDLIFLDPARRDSHGNKVFRLEDCTPNVVELLPSLLAHGKRLLLKLSPMLDLTQAIKSLSTLNFPYLQIVPLGRELSTLHWDIYVVAIKNEVKELLLLSGGTGQITAIDLDKKDQAFVFTREEESNSVANFKFQISNFKFIYEPSAAILKAGAYKLIAARFGLHKLDVNTHLYVSDALVTDFPGRVWKIKEQITNHHGSADRQKLQITNANVLVRNYPLTPDALKKKLHLRDGGSAFVIGCRVGGKPMVIWAERV